MSARKTVLITGASIGIGRATAEFFQAHGWNVAATMRNPEAGADLATLDNVLVTILDVNDEASIHAAVNATISRFGSIDVLVNNAGYGVYGILEATPMDDLRRQFETNVLGLLATTKAVIPVFRRQHGGIIINVSSVAGRIALPTGAPYCGSKFAVEGITEALRYEMKSIGVRVKLVEPGFIKTNFGNAMSFANDSSITAYQPLVNDFLKAIAPMIASAADPALAAEVIYRAATNKTGRLRYLVGKDAEQLIDLRDSLDDDAFFIEMDRIFER